MGGEEYFHKRADFGVMWPHSENLATAARGGLKQEETPANSAVTLSLHSAPAGLGEGIMGGGEGFFFVFCFFQKSVH